MTGDKIKLLAIKWRLRGAEVRDDELDGGSGVAQLFNPVKVVTPEYITGLPTHFIINFGNTHVKVKSKRGGHFA